MGANAFGVVRDWMGLLRIFLLRFYERWYYYLFLYFVERFLNLVRIINGLRLMINYCLSISESSNRLL